MAMREELSNLKREIEGGTLKTEHVIPTETMIDAIEQVRVKYLSKKNTTCTRKFKNTLPASLLKKMHPWKLAYEKELSKKQKRVRDSFKLFAVAFLCT